MTKLGTLVTRCALSTAIALMPAAMLAQGSMGSDSSMGNGSMGKKISASDKKFVMEAAQGGMAEVELGQLATQKASSDDVKKFGQRMIDDHTKANNELKEVASKEGVQLPTSVSAKDKMTKERLSKMSGADFDKAYMSDMVKDHTKDVADFKRESTSGSDPDVKDFASKTLPTLQSHLQEARKIAPANTTSASR